MGEQSHSSQPEEIEALLSGKSDVERMFAIVLDTSARRIGTAAFFINEGGTLRGWQISDGRDRRDISAWSIPRQSSGLYKKFLEKKPFPVSPNQADELKTLVEGKQTADWRRSLFGDTDTDTILCVPWQLGGNPGGLFLFACRETPAEELSAESGEIADVLSKNVLRLYSRERSVPAKKQQAPAGESPPPEKERKPAAPTKQIEDEGGGPRPPKPLLKLAVLSGEDAIAVDDLHRLLEADSALEAKVLKLASSPYYCSGVEPADSDEALSLLGTEVFRGVVLAAQLREMFLGPADSPPTEVRRRLWRHALACASIARIVARHLPQGGCEDAFAAGLLHDVGQVIFNRRHPEKFERWLSEYANTTKSIIAGETKVFDKDHTRAGEEWAREQGLPGSIIEAIAEHHATETGDESAGLSVVIEFADVICRYNEIGLIYRPDVPPDRHKSWTNLCLPDEVMTEITKDLALILAAEPLCL